MFAFDFGFFATKFSFSMSSTASWGAIACRATLSNCLIKLCSAFVYKISSSSRMSCKAAGAQKITLSVKMAKHCQCCRIRADLKVSKHCKFAYYTFQREQKCKKQFGHKDNQKYFMSGVKGSHFCQDTFFALFQWWCVVSVHLLERAAKFVSSSFSRNFTSSKHCWHVTEFPKSRSNDSQTENYYYFFRPTHQELGVKFRVEVSRSCIFLLACKIEMYWTPRAPKIYISALFPSKTQQIISFVQTEKVLYLGTAGLTSL